MEFSHWNEWELDVNWDFQKHLSAIYGTYIPLKILPLGIFYFSNVSLCCKKTFPEKLPYNNEHSEVKNDHFGIWKTALLFSKRDVKENNAVVFFKFHMHASNILLLRIHISKGAAEDNLTKKGIKTKFSI